MTATLDRYLDVTGLAKYIGVTKNWVYEAVEGGLIPHSRFGKFIRFSPKDVAEIEQMHRKAVST